MDSNIYILCFYVYYICKNVCLNEYHTSFLGEWYEYSKMTQQKPFKILRISFHIRGHISLISQKT